MYFKEIFALCMLVVAVAGTHYNNYARNYPQKYNGPHYREPSYEQGYKNVKLHKLCSWNVVSYTYANNLDRDDSWGSCKVDSGRAFVPENNIPLGFAFSDDRRVFVSLPRNRLGVYSTLAYFHLDDIKDEQCPPLLPYPPRANHTLDSECCSAENLVNVNRVSLDSHGRLWAVDRNALGLNDKIWEHGSPALVVYDLKTDTLIRRALLPSDMYQKYQLGLVSLTVNVNPKDGDDAYVYIVDTWNGCVVVYSYKQNKFWKLCSPEFFSDAKYSKLNVKTRKNKEVTYWKDNFFTDCSRDFKNQELVCTSDCSLDVFTIPFTDLNSEEVARCYPKPNVRFLGEKCDKCQSSVHTLNKETQVVWQLQEQKYGVGCWNRENPLTPESVQTVVSDHDRLPFVTDIELTSVDLSKFKDNYHVESYTNSYGYNNGNYIVVFSNNYQGVLEHGFDHYEENFGFYFFDENEALEAYPQCLQKSYSISYKPTTYHAAPESHYLARQSYQHQSYNTKPYQPPTYQPSYKPAPVYVAPKPTYHPQSQYASRQYTRTYRNPKVNEDVKSTEDKESVYYERW
uniref:CSON004380 protein n=1 Tax=Culicoides sonorensis TaxID=179676 RepID=A0A336MUW3_CULSO